MKKSYIQAVCLWLAVVIVNIVVFSKGLLGFSVFTGSALTRALAITDILASLILLSAGMYILLSQTEKKPALILDTRNPLTIEDTLERCKRIESKAFIHELDSMENQLRRMQRQKERMHATISASFQEGSLTYRKYMAGLEEADSNALESIAACLNQISIFDEEEYRRSPKAMEESVQETRMYVNTKLEDVQKILSGKEKLQREIADLPYKNDAEENAQSMREIEELIEQIDAYH